MPDAASEMRVAQRFAAWLAGASRQSYLVIAGPDPPDFLLEPQTWLEVSDIYLSNAQAKFLNSPRETRFRFHSSVDEPALRLLQKLDQKLARPSYRKIYDERGRGVLLLTCQDCFFDEVNLACVHEALVSFRPRIDQGFFREVYFEYRLPGEERVYERIYLPHV